LTAKTPLGRTVVLSEEYWFHIGFRHPEVGRDPSPIILAVSSPDEIYQDKAGGVHLLRKADEDHFLVVICDFGQGEGFIMTAYLTNIKRKSRRYRALQRIKRY
jgi:hypothetical protein